MSNFQICKGFVSTSYYLLSPKAINRAANMSTDKVETSSGTSSDTEKTHVCCTKKVVDSQGVSKKESEKSKIYVVTRSRLLDEEKKIVQEAKEKILSLDLTGKRKLYSCRNRYTELAVIQTWPEYYGDNYNANKDGMEKWWERNKKHVHYEVNTALNNKISIFCGDITTLEIDAIVNAANESLLGGGGVDGAIHRAAGRDLVRECKLLSGCKAGDAKITCGYKLPAKHVIHTVGPRGEHPDILKSCYQKCLDLVEEQELKTVAFPCISTGIFGYPNLNAANVVLKTVRDWLENEEYAQKVERILFCLFLDVDIDIYGEQMQLFFPINSGSLETESVSESTTSKD